MCDKNILKEEYLNEELKGFKHSNTGALIPKRASDGTAILPNDWYEDDDEDWEDYLTEEENAIIDKLMEGFVQRFTEDGVSIIPAAEDDDSDDNVWDEYL